MITLPLLTKMSYLTLDINLYCMCIMVIRQPLLWNMKDDATGSVTSGGGGRGQLFTQPAVTLLAVKPL